MNKEIITQDLDSLAIVASIVSTTEYSNGEMMKTGESFVDNCGALAAAGFYPEWLEFDDILFYVLSELRKVKNAYDGRITSGDAQKIAEGIDDSLKHAPNKYLFYFELPTGLKLDADTKIGEGIYIKKVDNTTIENVQNINKYTYLRSNWNLNNLLNRVNDEVKAEPNYKNLNEDMYYLVVESSGLNAEGHVSTDHTDNIDPMHIYKLLLSYWSLNGSSISGGILHYVMGKPSAKYGKEALIYKDNLEFVTDYARPLDEAEHVKGLIFSESIDYVKFTSQLRDFNSLITPMRNEYLETERNKIINSLYWYFEGEKSSLKSFQTLMLVSMFDAFFNVKDKQVDTIKSILKLCNITDSTDYDKYRKALEKIYKDRNDIAHGNVQMLEVARSTKQTSMVNSFSRSSVRFLYKTYIDIKIKKLLT